MKQFLFFLIVLVAMHGIDIGTAVVTTENTCSYPPATGRCKAKMTRYYYNSETKTCETFTYGGCGGNSNNFESKEECDETCNSCNAKPETGPCRAGIPRYYYDPARKQCEAFIYGGCLGNFNNFESEAECEKECKIDCTAKPKTGPCKGYFPRYYYNSKSQKCEEFIYGGCGGNSNNFESKEECEKECKPPVDCTAKPDPGPCKGYFPRYYYDPVSKRCREFIYGGCPGNSNNFVSKSQCLKACRRH